MVVVGKNVKLITRFFSSSVNIEFKSSYLKLLEFEEESGTSNESDYHQEDKSSSQGENEDTTEEVKFIINHYMLDACISIVLSM